MLNSHLDRFLAEVPEVGIERFTAGGDRKTGAEHEETVHPVCGEKTDGVHRVDGEEHLWLPEDSADSHHCQRGKPDQHDRSEDGADAGRAALLKKEEKDEDDGWSAG